MQINISFAVWTRKKLFIINKISFTFHYSISNKNINIKHHVFPHPVQDRRGTQPEQTNIDQTRIMTVSTLPLNEILVDFFDKLKSLTSGYAR